MLKGDRENRLPGHRSVRIDERSDPVIGKSGRPRSLGGCYTFSDPGGT